MIYWAPLIHFYQPPTQLYWVLKKICNESYRPLLKLYRELPDAPITININAVLTEMLDEHGMTDVIDGLRELASSGRADFTGSAKYHAILSLLSEEEVLRQIVINYQTNRRFLGPGYAPQGFFPPEMCYARNIVKPIAETGHRWIIMSGIACTAPWTTTVLYQIPSGEGALAAVFRDDVLSNRVSFRQTDAEGFVAHLHSLARSGEDTYVVTAMDAETFGHHIRDWETLFLRRVYELIGTQKPANPSAAGPPPTHPEAKSTAGVEDKAKEPQRGNQVQPVTISRLVELIPSGGPTEPRPSSWSTSIEDVNAGNPYPLWKSPDNKVHQLLWQHLRLSIEMTRKAAEVATNDTAKFYADIARNLLDRALHSDQFWWASRRPWWDMNLIQRGLGEQREVVFNAYKAICVSALPEEEKAEYYYRLLGSHNLHARIMDHLLLD